MAKPTLEELRRQALEDGEELVIDGRAFNASRERMPVVRKPAAPSPQPTAEPPKPSPAPAPTVDVVDAVRAVAASVIERDAAHLAAQSDLTARLAQAVGRAVAEAMKPTDAPTAQRPARWKLKAHYLDRGQIDEIVMTPEYD